VSVAPSPTRRHFAGNVHPNGRALRGYHALGEWVLRRACLEALSWPRVSVAVNVSPKQLRQPDFTDIVQKILLQTGLEPFATGAELTEVS